MLDAEKKQKRRPPESERYDELKGKNVCVRMVDGSWVWAVLQWVDHFTVGLRYSRTVTVEGIADPVVLREQVWITYKQAIAMIGEA